jgi:hypothetical protein
MRRFIATTGLLVTSLAIAFAQQQQQPQQQQSSPQQQPAPQGQPPAQGRGGQRGQGEGRQGGAPAKPIVPLAASTIVNNPDPYVGEYVSVTAAVEQPLTKSSFSVDQDKTKPDSSASW